MHPHFCLRQAFNNAADETSNHGTHSGNAPQHHVDAAPSEGAENSGSTHSDVPTLQCLGCEALVVELRESSDEAHELRARLADAMQALQVTLMLAPAELTSAVLQIAGTDSPHSLQGPNGLRPG